MTILGLNYFFHDSSACLVVDNKLVCAVEEERFTRRKHTIEFPVNSVADCLRMAGLSTADIEHIAVSIKPTLNWPEKLVHGLSHPTGAATFAKHEVVRAWFRQREFWSWYRSTWANGRGPKVHFVPHHLAHGAGSFYVSPYDSAAIMSLDGSGEWATAYLGHGKGQRVDRLVESYHPNSLGSFYEAATEFCGFKPNYDEGKTMGLAPFGDKERFYPIVKDLVRVDSDSRIHIDQSFFAYQNWGKQRCSPRFREAFGEARKPGAPFEPHHEAVAAAFQRVLEERVLELCHQLHERTKERYLVVSGGCSLNSVMNGRILRETPFEDLYVMPAAGDNGTCIGAAYYVRHHVLGLARDFVHDDPYLGTSHNDQQISKLLQGAKLPCKRYPDAVSRTARLLRDGNIVGWFQGRMEIGPRSLGNRSILADPTLPTMKDKVNAEVKHREAFRPFAPSAPVEVSRTYFDIEVDSPFMLKVCDVRPAYRAALPAITHVDGTARLQTVHRETNPRYHELISEFGKLSGMPVVLNTSFNVMGEPIVESPEQAVRCFYSTGIDHLVIGDYILSKQPAAALEDVNPARRSVKADLAS